MKKLMWITLLGVLLAGPAVQAQHGGWEGRRFGPPVAFPFSPHYMPHGHFVRELPLGFACLFIGGLEYYYWEGMYYRRAAEGYVVVPAPVGAVVTAVPAGCQTVVIDGTLYYIINGVTYMQTVNGYQVVPMPRVLVQPAAPPVVTPPVVTVPTPATPAPSVPASVPTPTPMPPPPVPTPTPPSPAVSLPVAAVENSPAAGAAATNDEFTVNIPNVKGSYTAVTLKRSGNGFIGPQGEFYTEFPRVEQLKLMYGK